MSPEEADAELDAIEAETPGLKERVTALLAPRRSPFGQQLAYTLGAKGADLIQDLAFEPNPEDLN